MTTDEIARMKANLDGLVREQAERRTLREQQGEEIKARSHEYMTKQVQAAERYVQHRRELGQRKTRSGWSTERTRADSVTELGFEPSGFAGEPGAGAASPFAPAPAPAQPSPRRSRRARDEVEEDDDAFLNNRWRD